MIGRAGSIKPGFVHIRAFMPPVPRSASTNPVIARLNRATSIPGAGDQSKGCGVLDTPLSRSMTAGSGTARAAYSRLLLHILDAGKNDALGALFGIAEIEFILGQEHRIAIDVIGDSGTIGGNERLEFLAVIGRNPARQLKLADFEFDRQRVFGIEPRFQHVELKRADHADQSRRAVPRA